MPNVLTRALMRLRGRSVAYDSVDQVREVLARRSLDTLTAGARVHTEGAAGLTDSLAFQPGLIDLHDELNDTWQYLASLADRATELGYESLSVDLAAAADDIINVLHCVGVAAETTVRNPR